MTRYVYSISIPYPAPINRKHGEWSVNHHQMLFDRPPSRRELLFFLHEKGDDAYHRSGNDNNIWWELIEVLSHFPAEEWLREDAFEEYDLIASNRCFEHPIMGIESISWEKMPIEVIDGYMPRSSVTSMVACTFPKG